MKQYINRIFEIPKGLDDNSEKIFMNKNTYAQHVVAFSKGLIVASESGFFGIWMKNEDPTNIQAEEDHKLIYLRGWSSDRFYSACSLDIY